MTAKILRKALPIQRGFEKMTIKLEQVMEAIEMSDDFLQVFGILKPERLFILPTHCLTEKPTKCWLPKLKMTQSAVSDFRPSTRYTNTASWRTLSNNFLPERRKAIFLIAFEEKVLFTGSRSLYAITV